jgi:hypothetical protein
MDSVPSLREKSSSMRAVVVGARLQRCRVGGRQPLDMFDGREAARRPKTSSSTSEFEPSRLAPLRLTQAHSPAANRPGRVVAAAVLVEMPPIM